MEEVEVDSPSLFLKRAAESSDGNKLGLIAVLSDYDMPERLQNAPLPQNIPTTRTIRPEKKNSVFSLERRPA